MSGFDKLARPYRWMEYASFGGALQRCRTAYLPELSRCRRALVMGDGDGRFLERLLREAPDVFAVAVDGSPAMLRELETRCVNGRVQTICADLSAGLPGALREERFDAVATHFFLDCLSDAEAQRLIAEVTACADVGCRWVISEFRVPEAGAMRWPGWLLVRALYVAFGWMTGLRVRRLPDYRAALRRCGWRMAREDRRMGGMLVIEMWER